MATTFRKILGLKRKIYENKKLAEFTYSQRTVERLQRQNDSLQQKVDEYEAIHGEVK